MDSSSEDEDDMRLEAMVEREKLILEKHVGGGPEIVPNKIKQAVCKAVCKIQLPEDSWGSGFFCVVSIDDQQYYGLCTNNHVIDFQYIRSNNSVTCISDDDQVVHVAVHHYSFTSCLLDATFIEVSIAQRREITNKGFSFLATELEVEEGQTILVGQHPRGQALAIETGALLEFTEDELGFYHSANTDYGSSGGPVANSLGRVIGIHRGGHWKRSVARNVGVLLVRVCAEMSRDSARTPAVREVRVPRNASIFLPSVRIRPVAKPTTPTDRIPSRNEPLPPAQTPTQPPAPPDHVPIFLLPLVKADQSERIVRPAKSAPQFKLSSDEPPPLSPLQPLPAPAAPPPLPPPIDTHNLPSRTVRGVCSAVCTIKIPNGCSGIGFLFGVNVDNSMMYGLLTCSKIVHSTYVHTYSSLRCKFGFRIVYFRLGPDFFKISVRNALFVELAAEERDRMGQDVNELQTRPHFSPNEPLFVPLRDDSLLVPLDGVADLDEAHFTFISQEQISPGMPIVNSHGTLVGLCKQRRERDFVAIKLTDILDTLVDERRRFHSKQQRRKRKDAQPGQTEENPAAPRNRGAPRASLNDFSDNVQNVQDVLTKTVCRVEAKSGTALGFFATFYGAGQWHFGLFTSERVIHSRYLQNNSYVRCAIGDEDVCIPSGSYAFCCPLFGVTFVEVNLGSKKNKKRESPLRRVPFLTVSLKDYESIVVLQRMQQKDCPPVHEGSVNEFRGVHFGYSSPYKSRLAGAPICDPFGFVLGLQTGRCTRNGLFLAAQMRYVCDAILRDKAQSAPVYPRVLQPLKPWKVEKLKLNFLNRCNDTVFVLHNNHDSEPIAWFRRTIHGWFWSPLDPLNRKIKDDAFWMRINKTDGTIIIGGKMHGKEAPTEVKTAIALLREHGEYFL